MQHLTQTTFGRGYEAWQNDQITLVHAHWFDVLPEIDFTKISTVVRPNGVWRNVRPDLTLAIFDPNMAFGDSAVQAIRTGRRYIGFETSPIAFERAREQAEQAYLYRESREQR